ncbi:MAG: PhzF family phenazine biosynthesis protein [Verrucomicrobiales bacterium]|nr:PhzF family phenazine biosynthesis protein [Verrucomicrobiales bacterium]
MSAIREIGGVARISAFVSGVLEGNPAGVWLGESYREAGLMQAVATEVGYAETVFLVRGDGGFRIRYFTPAVELPLAGHPTLAAAYHLWEEGVVERGEAIRFKAEGGEIEARPGVDGVIWMDFPADAERARIGEEEGEKIMGMLGLRGCAGMWRARGNVMVELEKEQQVFSYRADFSRVGEVEAHLVLVTAAAARGRDYDFVSRVFGPRVGVGEDPVTGSAHLLLGPHWAEKLGLAELCGYQASDRGGLVRIKYAGGERIEIGGEAAWIRSI